jgi:hypothetical protein
VLGNGNHCYQIVCSFRYALRPKIPLPYKRGSGNEREYCDSASYDGHVASSVINT